MSQKICSACKVPKPFSHFYRDRSRKLGITNACKPCMNERHKKWLQNNPVKARRQARLRWTQYTYLVRTGEHLAFQRSSRLGRFYLSIGLFFMRRYFALAMIRFQQEVPTDE